MAINTTTTWTCEDCGDQELFPGTDQQPLDWVRVIIVKPPKGDPTAAPWGDKTVCAACWTRYAKMLKANK